MLLLGLVLGSHDLLNLAPGEPQAGVEHFLFPVLHRPHVCRHESWCRHGRPLQWAPLALI